VFLVAFWHNARHVRLHPGKCPSNLTADPRQPPTDNRRLEWAAGPVIAPLTFDPAAGERQLIGAAVILAEYLYRPIRRRFAVAVELCQPLFARCHIVNLHCRACKPWVWVPRPTSIHTNKRESHSLNAVSVWYR
jgi:hypothetical protein